MSGMPGRRISDHQQQREVCSFEEAEVLLQTGTDIRRSKLLSEGVISFSVFPDELCPLVPCYTLPAAFASCVCFVCKYWFASLSSVCTSSLPCNCCVCTHCGSREEEEEQEA